MSSRVLAITAVTAAVVLSIVGCGGSEPRFDPATKYSPESLAQELAFRYKGLARTSSGPAVNKPEAPAAKAGVPTKGAALTKAAATTTLDGLLEDVIAKAGTIPGLSRAEACKQVAEAIAKDPSLPDLDKKTIADKLGQASP